MDTQTPYFLRHERFKLIRNFDGCFYIIEIQGDKWRPIAGPYITEEEAYSDIKNIIAES